jgi:hypothetical protein
VGRRCFISTSISGKTDSELKVGLYGDITPVQDDTSHEWRVYALDKKTGKEKWQRTACKGVPKVKRHTKNSHANSTLATDGERSSRSSGRRPLRLRHEGQAPVDQGSRRARRRLLHGAGGAMGDRQLADPARRHGHRAGRRAEGLVPGDVRREGRPRSLARFAADVPTWSTPTIHQVNGQTQILVNGMRHVGAYDFKTGKEIWKLSGGGDIPVPTPVVSDGLVYITNAHWPQSPVYAIKETAAGDVSLKDPATSNDAVAWSAPRSGGYMCTPLVYRGPRLHRPLQRRAERVRREERREEIRSAAGRRDLGLHLVPGRQRRQGLHRERGRPGLRARPPDRSTRCWR